MARAMNRSCLGYLGHPSALGVVLWRVCGETAVKSGETAYCRSAAIVYRPEETAMIATPFSRLRHLARRLVDAGRARVARWTRPAPLAIAVGAAADATRSRSALPLENALLRR